jgi:hypothetical protein
MRLRDRAALLLVYLAVVIVAIVNKAIPEKETFRMFIVCFHEKVLTLTELRDVLIPKNIAVVNVSKNNDRMGFCSDVINIAPRNGNQNRMPFARRNTPLRSIRMIGSAVFDTGYQGARRGLIHTNPRHVDLACGSLPAVLKCDVNQIVCIAPSTNNAHFFGEHIGAKLLLGGVFRESQLECSHASVEDHEKERKAFYHKANLVAGCSVFLLGTVPFLQDGSPFTGILPTMRVP